MLKACKIRLYPNSEQKQIIASQIGGSRYIFNRMLALKIFAYKKFGKNISKFELIKHATKLKTRDKTLWLKEIDSQVTQQSWGMFFELLEYKLKANGGELIKVDLKFTSQTCPKCKHISKKKQIESIKIRMSKMLIY